MPRATSHLVAMPRLVSWKSVFPRETLAFDTRNTAWHHACKNEVIIERYCSLLLISFVTHAFEQQLMNTSGVLTSFTTYERVD